MKRTHSPTNATYVDLDVKVLQVEGMLPDINTDDRDVSQERVLVSGGHDLETLGGGVQSLTVTNKSQQHINNWGEKD